MPDRGAAFRLSSSSDDESSDESSEDVSHCIARKKARREDAAKPAAAHGSSSPECPALAAASEPAVSSPSSDSDSLAGVVGVNRTASDAPPGASDDSDDHEGGLGALSDAEAAILAARPPRRPKVALRHHLYSFLDDRTAVDRDLQDLGRRGVVRLLQLPTDDVGVMTADDWRDELVRARHRCPGDVVDAFERLASLRGGDLYVHEYAVLGAVGPRGADGLQALVAAGLLRRRADEHGSSAVAAHGGGPARSSSVSTTYWIACPSFTGDVAARVRKSRHALVKALTAAKFKQLNVDRSDRRPKIFKLLDDPDSKLYLGFGLDFHLRDLVGQGLASLDHRANGRFLRLK